jgi:hypothetical protein
VSHNDDGYWQFLCEADHADGPEEPKLKCLACVLEQDPTVGAVLTMAAGQAATRSAPAERWRIYDELEE